MNTNRIKKIIINDYRQLHHVYLDDLSAVNVLSGVNNSGKTSVLEVIGLLSDIQNRANFQKWALFRTPAVNGKNKQKMTDYMVQIFPQKNHQIFPVSIALCYGEEQCSALIKGDLHEVISSGGTVSTELSVTIDRQDGTKPNVMKFKNGSKTTHKIENSSVFHLEGIFVEDDYYEKCVEYFNLMQLQDQKDALIALIRTFDPQIKDIFLDIAGDIYINHCHTGILPLFAYGSGMQKALLLASILSAKEPDVILVDEIDSALNISALSDVISWFIKACRKKNIQVFMTTHNEEAIDAVLENTCSAQDDIRIITLRNNQQTEQTEAKILKGSLARQYRNDFEMELRI